MTILNKFYDKVRKANMNIANHPLYTAYKKMLESGLLNEEEREAILKEKEEWDSRIAGVEEQIMQGEQYDKMPTGKI